MIQCYICKQIKEEVIPYPQGLTEIWLCPSCFSYLQNAKPSEVREVHWIYAFRKKGEYPESTSKSGKWLIFVDRKDVDEVWRRIKDAVEEGKLGNKAKVSTAKPKPKYYDEKKHVICVYTYDWTDREDVMRIREELRKLGIKNKIPYKADEDTLKGRYRFKGDEGISKYYE